MEDNAVPNVNRIEWIGKYAAIISALVAATVGIGQFRRGVSQSIRELEWKQADMARTVINGMIKDDGWQAMTMLDWEEGRTYELAPGAKVHIFPRDVPVAIEAALRTDGPRRTETQRFITDRFDRFLFQVSQLQAAVRSGLVRRDDVKFPLNWYVEKRLCAHKKLLLQYIDENSGGRGQAVLRVPRCLAAMSPQLTEEGSPITVFRDRHVRSRCSENTFPAKNATSTPPMGPGAGGGLPSYQSRQPAERESFNPGERHEFTRQKHRSHLPMPNTGRKGLITFDAKDPASKFPPIERLRPPKGAPNVLIVLIDDVGFGATSAFGGPCQTPTAEKLAAGGLKLTRFHTTALCSPTRQALLTGRNHHSVGMGGITEIATGAPGYCSVLPNSMSPLAQTLKLNGYSTAQFGKCHEVPVWETSPAGPFDAWPTGGGGFEYFYGFIGGEANQWYPTLYEGTTPVEPEKTPEEGYHLMEDMTDKAIGWIGQQKSLAPDRPFFIYFAPGATHAPHHVPKEWADKYKGKFDHGWDKLREEIFARQKKLGVIPQDCQLTPRHKEIPAWDEMPEGFKPVLRREMEVYAGFLDTPITTSGDWSTR